MKAQGYSAADIAAVQASDNPKAVGYYNSILYTEMVLLGWYYDLAQDKLVTDPSSIDPATISSNGAIVAGVWNDFAEKLIGLYQGLQQRGLNAAAGTEADTIMQQAQRAAAQVNLDILERSSRVTASIFPQTTCRFLISCIPIGSLPRQIPTSLG